MMLIMLMTACSDESRETNLVDLHTLADQNISSINFPANSETVFSTSSSTTFVLQGLKSNGEQVTIPDNVEWSLSAGAVSTIDNNGLFSAATVAENITVNAKFGPLVESLSLVVSDAKFDRVVQLHQTTFTIDMCRIQNLIPIGLYIGQNGAPNEERPVDNTIIKTIDWSIVDQGTILVSKRAFIETQNNQAVLNTLGAGDIVIQATALSVETGVSVTSVDFAQTINAGLTDIRLCNSTDTDLANCDVTQANLEENNVLPLVSIGTYQTTNGSDESVNISKNSKWGVSNNTEASLVFADDHQSIDVTGLVADSNPVVTVACGDIVQPVLDVDVSQGVILTQSVSCNGNPNCLLANATVNVTPLEVTSLSVSANSVDLITNQTLNLTVRPNEITLQVIGTFSNNTSSDVTANPSVAYRILQGTTVINSAGTPGVYTVLGAGLAEIEIDLGTEQFNAIINIP